MSVLRVTIEDLETGSTEVAEVEENDYFIITTGECHVSHTQVWPRAGTHILTIKGRGVTATGPEAT